MNWGGATVVIVAGGPSVSSVDLPAAKCHAERNGVNVRWIAINESWEKAPWAEILYACDWQWWGHRAPLRSDYRGLRVCGNWDDRMMTLPRRPKDIQQVTIAKGTSDLNLSGEPLGAGGSSAFQAANLALVWGARKVCLVGVDCKSPNEHWHPPHSHLGAPRQTEQTMESWLVAWRRASLQLLGEARGREIVVCSSGSSVDCFRHSALKEELQ